MALTKVGPAGIGSVPGIGITIGNSHLHTLGLDSLNANFTGIVTTGTLRVTGNFQVDGTTTTLDTEITSVDKLEVAANNTTVGVAITQSGTGDILNLYDGSTEVFSVRDGGNVGIKNATGLSEFPVDVGGEIASKNANKEFIGINLVSNEARIRSSFFSGASGAYRPITFYTSDAERLRINSNGTIGSGVAGGTYTFQINDTDSSCTLQLTNNTIGNGTGDGTRITQSTSGILYIENQENSHTILSTAATERLRITSAGKVGIGLTNPLQTFVVKGVSANGGNQYSLIQSDNSSTTGGGGFEIAQNGTRVAVFAPSGWLNSNTDSDASLHVPTGKNFIFYNQTTEALRITSDGNVLVGTTDANNSNGNFDDLIIGNNASTTETHGITIVCGNASSNGGIAFSDGSGADAYRGMIGYEHADNSMRFRTNAVERLRITSAGDMGLGVTDATILDDSGFRELVIGGATEGGAIHLQDADGNVKFGAFTSDASNAAFIRTITNHPIVFRTNNTERLRIDANGKIGVGGAPNTDWHSAASSNVIQVGSSVLFDFSSAQFDVGHNYYYDGTNYKFTNTGYAARMTFSKSDGSIRFWSLGTGSAGANATVTDILRIQSDGDLEYRYNDADTSTQIGSTQVPHGLRIYNTNNTSGRLSGISFSHGGAGTANIGIFHEQLNTAVSSGSCLADLVFYTKNSGVSNMTEKLRIDSSGRLLIAQSSSLLSYAGLQIKGDADSGAHICLAHKTATPVSGNNIGSIRFTNNAGGIGAIIGVEADGNWSGSSQPTRISIATATSGSTSVTEKVRITNAGHLSIVGDNQKLLIGSGDDIQIYHSGSHSFIEDAGTGGLYIRGGGQIGFRDSENSFANMANFNSGGSIDLYYNGAKKFETHGSGIKVAGRVFLGGSTNGGFDYNSTADTLEFLTTNGGTHSELTSTAYVPNTNAGKTLGYHNKRWDTLYVNKVAFGGSTNTDQHSLDDYEEGSWTPTVTGGSYSIARAYYIKVGRKVSIFINVGLSSPTGATFTVSLPFAAITSGYTGSSQGVEAHGSCMLYNAAMVSSTYNVCVYCWNGTASLYASRTSLAWRALPGNEVGSSIQFTAHYVSVS